MSNTPSFSRVLNDAIETKLTGLHTMLPGKVVAIDVAAGKCDVQPSIQRLGFDGTPKDLPIITNCPIGFYRAGKAAVYLPLAVGHDVEIRFCERSLDVWLTKGGTVDPADQRKHNLSDAVVYPGLYDLTQPPIGADPSNLVVINDKSILTLKPSGETTIVNDSGTFEMSSDGKFKFQGVSDELLAVLLSILDILIAGQTLDPLTGPVPSFLVGQIAQLNVEKIKLQGLQV